jgi:PAS domain S-box-containing protein
MVPSEGELQTIIDTIPALAWAARPDGSVEFFNRRWLDYTGLSAEQARDWNWATAIHPDDLSTLTDYWRSILDSGEPGEIEARLRRFDGEYRWFLFRASPLRDQSGKVVKWYGTNTDIDDRKRAEDALRKSEERWRSVFENSAIGVALTDLNGRFLAANNVYQKVTGYTERELRALYFLDVTHEDYREANWALITELLEGKRRQFQIEKKYRRKDGNLIWVRNNVSLVPGTERVPRFIMALTEDVTERKDAEQALKRSESYLAEAQKLSHTGSFGWRPSTGEMIWSEETSRIFEYDRTTTPTVELILQRLYPEEAAFLRQIIERGSQDVKDFDFEHRLRMPDGSIKHLRVVGRPSKDESGSLEFVGAVMDISDRKRTEEKLRRSEADLLEAQRLSQTGSWKLDASSGTVTVSPQAFRIFGVQPDEDTSTREFWLSRNHIEDQKRIQELFETATTEKTDYEADYRIVLPEGTIKHLHAVGHPVLNEAGNLEEFVGTVMDITERKRAEEALRRSEGYLAEAQRLTRTGSWAWDVRTGALYWSREIFRIYDYEPQEVVTWPQFLERVHPEDRPHIEQRAKIESSEKEWVESQTDFRIVLPDGTIKHLHTVARPVRDGSGDITEVVGTVMDVTEQWKARIDLERAFEEIKRLKDRLQDENLALREEIDKASMFEEIVGNSPVLQTALTRLSKVAPTDSGVLVTGETGTGKELIARAIHRRSQRSSGAFVSVNCTAIPRELIASELFGHEKGAFTGATEQRLGRFELANGGTLFLDEVGELPAETQIALLRVLQEHEFERVGGTQSIPSDARVIAATNRDLEAAIAEGTFRSDLFYRLNVFPIEIPPLRERREDIPMLVEYFIDRYARKTGKKIRAIEKRTLELLRSYDWPGNVRELQNVIERSLIVCETQTLSVDESWLYRPSLPTHPRIVVDLSEKLAAQEKEMIEAALRDSGARVSGPGGAAAMLGMPASTLESKIRAFKINKNRFKTADPSTSQV